MKTITLGKNKIEPNNPTYIIAEMSCNHMQDYATAVKIVRAAASAGADAIKISISKNLDYKKYIHEFLALKPKYFHITDGFLTSQFDEHLNLGDGEFDLKWIKTQIEKIPNAMVVLETPKHPNNLSKNLKNLKYFQNL